MPNPETIISTDLIPTQKIAGVARTWDRFEDITTFPRKTGNEQAINAYVEAWADEREYKSEIDSAGNLLVLIPATKGYENAPGTIIQAHTDMVCVGEPDPAKHGVKPVMTKDGYWIEADGTSLGSDNGIGLAAAMALPEDLQEHGPLALMVTVAEEVGLTGAMAMSFETPLDDYKYLINFDSEDEGEATISCAGGGDTEITLPVEREPFDGTSYTLAVENLLGGHSGVEIHKGRTNGIKVLTRVTNALVEEVPSFRVSDISAGYARNVIPSNVEARVSINPEDIEHANEVVKRVRDEILAETQIDKEKKMEISLSESRVLTQESAQKLLNILTEVPDGVISWSQEVEGLVETSNNVAVVNIENNKVVIETMTRSSVDSDVDEVRGQIQEIAERNGATVELSDPYPGWPANPDSEINSIASEEWKKLTENELKIIAIHAGLECGVIIGKYPHLEAISIGPTIKGAHSDKERVRIDTVETFYKFARNILLRVADVQ